MNDYFETADGQPVRRENPFPREWGVAPHGEQEVRAWIKHNIAAGEERRSRGLRVPWLGRRPGMTGREALAVLHTRLHAENTGRLRKLADRCRGPQ